MFHTQVVEKINTRNFRFKVCKSAHHLTIQINHQPDATIFPSIILTFIYSSPCFGCSLAHHQELNDCSSNLWFYLRTVLIAVLCSWSGRPARTRTQHGYHHGTKVKPEAATAVVELLMMDGRIPETCWAVNKRQDNRRENCCIWLVIYLDIYFSSIKLFPKFLPFCCSTANNGYAKAHTGTLYVHCRRVTTQGTLLIEQLS